jgi:hypothetical protein
MRGSHKAFDRDKAETIALAGLVFLAEDAQRLGRFLALTGIGPAELKAGAEQPAVLGAVLDHLLGDETLLLTFAANAGLPAQMISMAKEALGGASEGA